MPPRGAPASSSSGGHLAAWTKGGRSREEGVGRFGSSMVPPPENRFSRRARGPPLAASVDLIPSAKQRGAADVTPPEDPRSAEKLWRGWSFRYHARPVTRTAMTEPGAALLPPGVALITTAFVTALSYGVPAAHAGSAVGLAFLGVTYWLALRDPAADGAARHGPPL